MSDPATTTSPVSPASSLTAGTPPSLRERRWSIGTLTYSLGGLALLFLWLLGGDFGFYLKERAMPNAMQLLLRKFDASDFLAALLIVGLPQGMAVLLVPFVGFKSDRYRSRWGRRIPFLFVTTPVAVASMVGLAYGPTLGGLLHGLLGAHSPGYNSSVLLMLGLNWAVFEFVSVVGNCLFISLINDVVPKMVIGRFYAAFRIISLLAGMSYSYSLMGHVEQYFRYIFLGIAFVYGFSFSLMCLRVREGEYGGPEAAPMEGFLGLFMGYLRDAFSHSYYRWIFLSIALGYMATLPINLFTVYYAKAIDLSIDSLGKYQTLQLMVSLLVAYPAGWLADKFHALRMTMVALGLLAIGSLLAFFLIHTGPQLGIATVGVGALAGFWATAMVAIGPMLFPGERFATMQSALTVCYSLGMMLVGPVCGWLLDQLGHDYSYQYYWCFLLSLAAFLATWIVYRRFQAYGGMRDYRAP